MIESEKEEETGQNSVEQQKNHVSLQKLLDDLAKIDQEERRKNFLCNLLTILGLGLLIYVIFAPHMYLRGLAVGCFMAIGVLFDSLNN